MTGDLASTWKEASFKVQTFAGTNDKRSDELTF